MIEVLAANALWRDLSLYVANEARDQSMQECALVLAVQYNSRICIVGWMVWYRSKIGHSGPSRVDAVEESVTDSERVIFYS